MKTFFAVVNIPKAQLKGDGGISKKYDNPSRTNAPKWDGDEPIYKTEAAVTAAIIEGTFKPCQYAETTLKAYDRAKAWQKYQKALDAPKFFKKQEPKPNHSRYTHVFFGGR